MDTLASLNIIPFLGLMNILEVKYLHMPEVYRTMLAILCDYNPLIQSNIIRTRRYLKVLLAREPDLAQCLLNFMDEPQENTQSSTNSSAAGSHSPDSEVNQDRQPKPILSATLLSTELHSRSALNAGDDAASLPSSAPAQQSADSQSLNKTDAEASVTADYKGNCLINIDHLTAAVKPAGFPMNIFQMNTTKTLSSLTTSGSHHADLLHENHLSFGDRMPHFIPIINIHHKGVFSSDAITSSACVVAELPAQDLPLFLPRLLSSPITPSPIPAGLEQTLLPVYGVASAISQERKSSTLTLQQFGNQMPAQRDSVTALSSSAKPRPNFKGGRKCRVAQTQTSATDLSTVNQLHGDVTSKEIPNTVRKSNVPPTIGTSSTKYTIPATTTASQPSTGNPNICLSKLLGQPSVSYHLPAGHFIDNRNCIVGGPKSAASAEKEPHSTTAVSVKVSSAAAKLRLLSTQAGGEKTAGSVRAGYGKATATVTAKLGSLSVQTPSEQREIRNTTVLKFSSRSGESGSKALSLSKILPVPKLTAAKSAPSQKTDTVSFDKQVQVGQRQVSRKSKVSTHSRQPVSQVFSASRQHAPELPENQTDWPKSSVKQQGGENVPSSQEEGPDFQEVQRARKNQSLRQETHSQKLPTGQQESQRLLASLNLSTDKHVQQSGKPLSSKSAAVRQKVHVVEVSLGATHSLSTFPYIQQILLPDGQVSTIAHNSPNEQVSAIHKIPNQTTPESDESTKVSSLGKSPATTRGPQATQAGKASSTKQTTQTQVLPRNQVQLSVSIQTSSAKVGNASGKKRKLAACPSNSPGLAEAKCSPAINALLQTGSEVQPEETESAQTKVSGHSACTGTQELPDAATAGASRVRGKRKRSTSSCTRLALKKSNKENSAA